MKKFDEFAFDRETYGVTDSFQKLKILKEILTNAGILTVDISQEENFYNLIQYYARLVDDENIFSSSEEIKRWLEIDFTEQKSITTENSSLVNPITEEEFLKHTQPVNNSKKRKVDIGNFMKKYGIEKDSDNYNFIAEKFFNGKIFKKGDTTTIQDNQCVVKSAQRSDSNSTVYFFIYANSTGE